MQKNKGIKNRKSYFNPDRSHYLTKNGRYYVYEYWDIEKECTVKLKLEAGKDISLEVTRCLDEEDWEMDKSDRKAEELRDPLFDEKVDTYYAAHNVKRAPNPWSKLATKDGSPEDILFAEAKPENPKAEIVHTVIEENCTEAQQDLFYRHYGMGEQLEKIRQDEIKATGKTISNAAMTQRANKILDKTAKALGTERVKRHRHPSKD